ncbi:protein tweety-like isoform X1 [Limulus polyphemus]|uniref:Protein tweety homolog n=1 Tax=Limulus polyphemus TaxID=6850 RepID=A0ABM1SDL6_LIMPO|nr:protein tweety-like isoform X1 [Limulus polyphemus]
MVLYSSEKFEVTHIARWFHVLPHVDITFKPVNATFDVTNNSYLEALGILIAVPGFWLILTLLAFLVFFLCRCCDASLKKKRKLTPLKWTLAIFALLCCGALSLGLFGNDQTHNGMKSAQTATENMEDIVMSVRNETREIEFILNKEINKDLDKLADLFKEPISNSTARVLLQQALAYMRSNVSKGVEQLQDINNKIDHVDLNKVPDTIHKVELFRWPVTISLLCVLIFFCFILLWGIIRHSRCFLIFFSVVGLMSVVLCWVLVSLYLGLCVAGSDFCLDPQPFLYKQAGSSIDTNVLTYYLQCDDSTVNPFTGPIKESTKTIDNVESTLNVVTQITSVFYPEKQVRETLDRLSTNLNTTEKTVSGMAALLNCQAMHKEYNAAMQATCIDIMEGTAYMLVSAAGAGLFFTVLIWVASHTWIHIRRKRRADHVDEEDPFLPPSAVQTNSRRNRDTYGSMGLFPRFGIPSTQTPHFSSLNGHSSDQAYMQGHYTPPPSYHQLSGGAFVGNQGNFSQRA